MGGALELNATGFRPGARSGAAAVNSASAIPNRGPASNKHRLTKDLQQFQRACDDFGPEEEERLEQMQARFDDLIRDNKVKANIQKNQKARGI